MEESIVTGEGIKIKFTPLDRDIADACIETIFKTGSEFPNLAELISSLLADIGIRGQTKSTWKVMQKSIAERIADIYTQPKTNEKANQLVMKLAKTAFFPDELIIDIWHQVSLKAGNNQRILSNLINIIEFFSQGVRSVYGNENAGKIQEISGIIQAHLYDREMSNKRHLTRSVLNYLKKLLNSQPKIELRDSEEFSKVDGDFKEIVARLMNKQSISGHGFKLNNPKTAAKFYFTQAIINHQTAVELGEKLWLIIPAIEVSGKFGAEIIALCQRHFIMQHGEATKKNFTKDEILTTNRFICELLLTGVRRRESR
jgi:hypothetical protein